MKEARSAHSIIQSVVDIKSWIDAVPDVDQVRPAWCPRCRAPRSREVDPWEAAAEELRSRSPATSIGLAGDAQALEDPRRRGLVAPQDLEPLLASIVRRVQTRWPGVKVDAAMARIIGLEAAATARPCFPLDQ